MQQIRVRSRPVIAPPTPVETAQVRVRTRPAQAAAPASTAIKQVTPQMTAVQCPWPVTNPSVGQAVWPNGSACYVAGGAHRRDPNRWRVPDEEQPLFRGRIVHHAKRHYVWRYTMRNYRFVGSYAEFTQALNMLFG